MPNDLTYQKLNCCPVDEDDKQEIKQMPRFLLKCGECHGTAKPLGCLKQEAKGILVLCKDQNCADSWVICCECRKSQLRTPNSVRSHFRRKHGLNHNLNNQGPQDAISKRAKIVVTSNLPVSFSVQVGSDEWNTQSNSDAESDQPIATTGASTNPCVAEEGLSKSCILQPLAMPKQYQTHSHLTFGTTNHRWTITSSDNTCIMVCPVVRNIWL